MRLIEARERTVAISPIVGGSAIKGPADALMRDLGFEASVIGDRCDVRRCCLALWSSTPSTRLMPVR
ncbi:MAG: hypothetical protein V9F03_16350 [Microthrixaceae bacterium]